MSCRLKTSKESRIQIAQYYNILIIFLLLKMEMSSHQDKAPGHTWRLLSGCRSSHRTLSSSSHRVHMSLNRETRASTHQCPSLWKGKGKFKHGQCHELSLSICATFHMDQNLLCTIMKIHQILSRLKQMSFIYRKKLSESLRGIHDEIMELNLQLEELCIVLSFTEHKYRFSHF